MPVLALSSLEVYVSRMGNSTENTPSETRDFLSRAYWNGTIKMSLSKFFILSALYRRPMHGYEIAKEVASISNGCCSPAEGTIYPVLKQYEEGGYVTAHEEIVSGRTRKVYELTDKGRQAFQVAVDAWMEVTKSLTDCQDMLRAS